MPPLLELVEEASRQLAVCNSCRYCEGYCAVFPALERRGAGLTSGDVSHLANICHDCRACLQACMYAPPHELAVDIPAVLTQVRAAGYRRFAWPGALGAAFESASGFAVLAALVGLLAALLGVLGSGGFGHFFEAFSQPGSFYRIVRYELMVVPGLILSAYIGLIFVVGFVRFWRETGDRTRVRAGDLLLAAWEALTLRWQEGGGPGCYFPDEARPSRMRRYLHVTLVTGFGLAFLSTLVAAAEQDILGLLPPYPLLSVPVVLGTVGGLGMVVGCSGLLAFKFQGPVRSEVKPLDISFLVVLGLAALSGLALLAVRDTPLMPTLLTLHLAILFGLYLTVPYGKLVHAVYRYGALVRNRLEVRSEG